MAESRYLLERRKLKSAPESKGDQAKAEGQAKGGFFKQALAMAPRTCENCGKPLAGTMAINPAAVVAHILAKRKEGGCPSVQFEPRNKWYACGDCHTNYDNKGAAFVQNMAIFEVLKTRVATFYHLIPSNEARNVPDYFIPAKNEKFIPPGPDKGTAKKGRKPVKTVKRKKAASGAVPVKARRNGGGHRKNV